MTTATGTVFRSGAKERISSATIKATKGDMTEYTTAGEGGDFRLDLPEAGEWNFVAFEKGSYASKPVQVDMDQEKPEIKIYLDRIAGTEDNEAGKTFFWILIGILGALIAVYLVLHLVVFNTGKGFEIWSTDPLRYLEIILWGFAGVLVSKIISVAWYLRIRHYYREGLVMHISHLVATPILVLVIVLLLAQVNLTFTLANKNEINLDLASYPNLMVAFAFIIGTAPWALWNFVLNSAKRFTGQLEG